jgi:hypothetical protein
MSFDFDQIVENHFKERRDIFGFESIAQLIEEVLDQRADLIEVLTEAEGKPSIDMGVWDGIVDIPISEIPWATVTTQEGGAEVPSRQRAQLEQFLARIEGEDLPAKLASLTEFYDPPEGIDQLPTFQGSKGSRVSNAIAYLTFYKTLTKIIAHFNASSAGFSFEAFLGVLLGGTQIAASGAKTIADITTGDGTPVSLKLYNEGTLKVGGSYNQLVNDLIGEKRLMQYVVATKTLEGEGEELDGSLDFYRFNFTLNNVASVLSQVGRENPHLIQLPLAFIANPEQFNVELPDPPSIEELVTQFNQTLNDKVAQTELGPEIAQALVAAVDWPKNTALFVGKKIAGRSGMVKNFSKDVLAALEAAGINAEAFPGRATRGGPLDTARKLAWSQVIQTNAEAVDLYTKATQNRAALVAQAGAGEKGTEEQGSGFADTARSVEEYNKLSDELKVRALLVSRGFIYTDQFELTRPEVYAIGELQNVPDVFPAGQESVHIGHLKVGHEPIGKMVAALKDVMDTSIFEIFRDLKVLTTNLQAFFANGLQETQEQPYASEAQAAATSIDKGVEETAQEFSTEEN